MCYAKLLPLLQVADSCLPPTQHTVEYKALKFGDQLDSHVLIPLQSKTFKKNFNVSFEFRTYYPNGLFFIAAVSSCDVCIAINLFTNINHIIPLQYFSFL